MQRAHGLGQVGKTQLENNVISDAIDSYLNSEDPTDFGEGCRATEREDHLVDLTRYLLRART